MRLSPLCTLALVAALAAPAFTQQPTPAPDEDVVRITTNLVQLDAVVTDKNGRQVTDLRAEEFEVFEDGKPQPVTHFAYVSTASAPPAPPPSLAAPGRESAPPPAPLKREQVRRSIALVVDDLGMAHANMVPVRAALRRFVDEQMQPGDLVAIVRLAGDVGALQQFTNDKRLLRAAIERIRWVQFTPCDQPDCKTPILSFIVRGMSGLPGRRSLVLFTDNLPLSQEPSEIGGRPNENPATVATLAGMSDPSRDNYAYLNFASALRRLVELAVRTSVVVYAVDTRGLPILTPTVLDGNVVGRRSPQALLNVLSARSAAVISGREGAQLLARQTGGFLIRNTNDITGGLRQVMEAQRGYYLLGYNPSGDTFDRRFHQLKVRVKRGGLTVHTREGFYGYADEAARPAAPGARDQLTAALTSPFGGGDVEVRLTTLFSHEPTAGSFLRALLHVDARALTFSDEPGGWHKAVVDVSGILFGNNGQVVNEERQTHTLTLSAETYERFLRDGFVYRFDLPVKRPGAYQFRVAVRDAATARVGAAGQFVEVPNLGAGRLALSGLIVRGDKPDAAASAAPVQANGGQAQAADDPQAGPALRRLRPGMTLAYSFIVFNAQLDKATNGPRLRARARLFRDGEQVFASDERPLEELRQVAPAEFGYTGRLALGGALPPGPYLLQIAVTDTLAHDKQRATAEQWLDFEIVGKP
ncbi:MAG TPA: VWA domain-containing protein [Pyrinomonadaceae bacterium]|jgi:VWFA-related protein